MIPLFPINSIFMVLGLISVFSSAIAAILTLHQFMLTKNRLNLYTSLGWIFWLFFLLTFTLSGYFSIFNQDIAIILMQISMTISVAITFSMTLAFDTMSRESADPIKLIIISFVSAALIIFSMTPGSLHYEFSSGVIFFYCNEVFILSFFILMGFLSYIHIFYNAKILWVAPNNLKFPAFMELLGVIFLAPGALITLVLGTNLIISGISFLFIGLGTLPVAIVFAKYSKLSYILPFKALRLTIIETNSGIAIFNHVWNKLDDLVDEQLFSGMLQAISQILNESLKRGNVQEIRMDRAVLFVKRLPSNPIACILASTKSSSSLQHALDSFSDHFSKDFALFFDNPHMIDNFDSAKKLVEIYFPFIPEYD